MSIETLYTDYIAKKMTESDLLCQIAEEAAELAQAALKMRRVLSGSNPTPTSESVALSNLIEEIADVRLCVDVWCKNTDIQTNNVLVRHFICTKAERWYNRLKQAENEQRKEGGRIGEKN